MRRKKVKSKEAGLPHFYLFPLYFFLSPLGPLVPGLLSFRARVILLPDGPTCPIQRLPGRGKVSPFPHPEPPLLFSSCLFCPAVAAGQVRKNWMSPNSRPGRMGRRTRGNRAKQSQTWAGWDIWERDARKGQWRKTKPIRAEAAWDEAPGVWDAGQSCETKPIPAAGKKWQVLCERGVMVNCSVHRPRQNKANLAITAGIRKRIVQNEANLRSSGRPDGPGTRRRMAATPKDWHAVYRRVR